MTTDSEQKKSGRQRRLTAVEIRERERQAYQLKIGGATFFDIARSLNMEAASTALRAYRRYLARTADPDTVEYQRDLELGRLEDLRSAIYAQAVGDPGNRATGRAAVPPDLGALNSLLSIHDRKVKLLGLNRAPTIDPTEELLRYAREHDLDPDLVLRQADAIIAQNAKRWQK